MDRVVTAADVERAAQPVAAVARRTPVLDSWTLTERAGGEVVLKAESLQRAGSFKVRGASSKLAALGADAARGVVAGSAGNHAWALALAARRHGVPCEVFMPPHAPLSKIAGCRSHGATVIEGPDSVDGCVAQARERAQEAGMALVHPFDDPDVVAGQGTVGLELLEQVPELAQVVVPLGGGGLAAGTAVAVKSALPQVRVIAVQAAAMAAYPRSLAAGRPVEIEARPTIADGIALRKPGEVTFPLVAEWIDEVVTVGEDDIAEAMVLLLERARLVVEGAGAVGVAALLTGAVAPVGGGKTCVVLSGGNADAGLLASVTRLHESRAGRRLVLFTRISDMPGGLARLVATVAAAGGNLIDVEHVREGVELHVRETGVQLVLETRVPEHAAEVVAAVRAAGYEVTSGR